jgi:hypothetical protein
MIDSQPKEYYSRLFRPPAKPLGDGQEEKLVSPDEAKRSYA